MATGAKAPDGRQARWAKHNEERRQVIIDAALAVVEAGEPGAEFHVQQIAEQAGLSRSVVYRHFTDRADLDHAIQVQVLEDLTDHLLPAVNLEGTINEVIRRIVTTYVRWAVEHPALHRLVEHAQSGAGSVDSGINRVATVLVEVLQTVVDLLGVDLDEDDAAALDPLAFGLVGAVFGAVRRWVGRRARRPDADQLAELLSQSVWHILAGHADRLGLHLDPDVPLEELLAVPDPEAAGA